MFHLISVLFFLPLALSSTITVPITATHNLPNVTVHPADVLILVNVGTTPIIINTNLPHVAVTTTSITTVETMSYWLYPHGDGEVGTTRSMVMLATSVGLLQGSYAYTRATAKATQGHQATITVVPHSSSTDPPLPPGSLAISDRLAVAQVEVVASRAAAAWEISPVSAAAVPISITVFQHAFPVGVGPGPSLPLRVGLASAAPQMALFSPFLSIDAVGTYNTTIDARSLPDLPDLRLLIEVDGMTVQVPGVHVLKGEWIVHSDEVDKVFETHNA